MRCHVDEGIRRSEARRCDEMRCAQRWRSRGGRTMTAPAGGGDVLAGGGDVLAGGGDVVAARCGRGREAMRPPPPLPG